MSSSKRNLLIDDCLVYMCACRKQSNKYRFATYIRSLLIKYQECNFKDEKLRLDTLAKSILFKKA